MHMADALVSPIVAGTMYACSSGAMGFSIKKVRIEDDPKKIPVMGIMGAFVFATQMINFTIPGTGSSGHLAGGMLLTAILGPYAGFMTMIGVLLIQSLLFADGGILALGCNVWNMAFYGCFAGGFIIWRSIMKNRITKRKITIASIVGCIVTLQLGAFSVTLETLASGITELPFPVFVATLQPIQFVIGLVEGLITAAVLCFVQEARPELLWTGSSNENFSSSNEDFNTNNEDFSTSNENFSTSNENFRANNENLTTKKVGKMSFKSILIFFAIATIIIISLLSQFASSKPDGLEWSIERITGSKEVATSGTIYEIAKHIQGITSILPDYSLKGSESLAGTSFSGIVGGIIVVSICVLCSCLIRFFRKRMKNGKNK